MAINNELWALDASTGELVTRFADQGTLDLRCGLARPMEEVGYWRLTTPSYRLYGSPHRRRLYFGRLWGHIGRIFQGLTLMSTLALALDRVMRCRY